MGTSVGGFKISTAVKNKPRLSVVIPCYNEQECLSVLVGRVVKAASSSVGEDFEFILVDDGSSDATWSLIKEAADTISQIVAVQLSRNYGHQIALTAGLKICTGERVFVIDADLQDPPELLSAMMEEMDQGYDVIYGVRNKRQGETAFKKISAALFYRLINRLSNVEIPQDTGDFRLMSRRALDALNDMPEQNRFIRGMVSWIGFRQKGFLFDRDSRYAGDTKYPLSKMIAFAFDAITGFSTKPLKLAGRFGLMLAMIGGLLLLYTLSSFFTGHTVPGWASLMTVVVLMGSVQMFVLAVMGEYLGRLYQESKRRPLFYVQEIYSKDTQAD